VTNLMSERARRMRRDKSDAEVRLWRALRDLNRRGFQFRQQAPIGPYIADFCDHSAKLVLEVDGAQHGESKGLVADRRRTRWLESQGYRVRRFWNHEVLTNFDGVETEIFVTLGLLTEDGHDGPNTLDLIPSPLVGGGRGGGHRRTSAIEPLSADGRPPTPNPSPQGGGGFAPRSMRRRRTRATNHV
jgi:very-short-patch-repair endonuclease